MATAPVDGTGDAINLNQSAAQAAASMNCTLAVPANPLSAQGLATPWQLGDGCSMANAGTERAFVEATILAPNGSVQVYNPLVITAGTQAAVAPTAPTIAAGSVVDHQTSASTAPTWCSPALAPGRATASTRSGQSVIGQVSACNAVNFYQTAANAASPTGTLTVPAGGHRERRPAVPDHARLRGLIDQDQSDNVITTYLINGNGQTAQAPRRTRRHSPAPRRSSTAATTSCWPRSSTRRTGARRSPRPTPQTRTAHQGRRR